jgi:hypothetical protein
LPGIRQENVNTVIGESPKPVEVSGGQPGQDRAVPCPQDAYPELVIGRKRTGMRHEYPRARLLPPATAYPPAKLCGSQGVQCGGPGQHGRCHRLPDSARGLRSVAGHEATVPSAGRARHPHVEPVDIAGGLSTGRNVYPTARAPSGRLRAPDLSAIRAAITTRIALKSDAGAFRRRGGGERRRSGSTHSGSFGRKI